MTRASAEPGQGRRRTAPGGPATDLLAGPRPVGWSPGAGPGPACCSTRDPSCAVHSASRGEPLATQAPLANGWVLLEHPGPWGPQPAADSHLIPGELRAAIRERRLRVNLIRRHRHRHRDREERRSGPGACLLYSSAGPTPFVEELWLEDPRELLPHALDAVVACRPSGLGIRLPDPLYLICTHGRKDACCARFGRPVAHAAADLVGERAWETSHVGGCRFAANMVCLPSGVYYGRVTPADLPALLSATEDGRIGLPWYRGRAGSAAWAQAADALLRRLTGLDQVDAVRLVGAAQDGDSSYRVDLSTDHGRYRLTLRARVSTSCRLTCASGPGTTLAYQVVWVMRLS